MAPQEHATNKDVQNDEAQDALDGASPVRPRLFKRYGGEIAIAGMSGRFPESDGMTEFQQNLFNKVNMITADNRRWEPGYMGTPLVMGKVKHLNKFDAEFFGINNLAADTMDPQMRAVLETAYEALVDAGESMASLKGSRTGVYVGVTQSEAESAWFGKKNQYVILGCPHSVIPNRISFFFDLKGPSVAYDTACSSSLTCLEAAERHMRDGVVDQAIICAVNFNMRPATSKVFTMMSMLGDTACKVFDQSGDGFVRGEVAGSFVLKKSAAAKRIYATVEGCLVNCDGFTPKGITFPNRLGQEEVMRDVYLNYKINPHDVKYFEAHGTGTPAGDPEETSSICNAMCSQGRRDPLLIGSAKSNCGHGEVASGMAAFAKVVIACNERVIPPNLHFNTPNPNIPGLFDGRLKVVTEPTPLDPGSLVAVNSFGMTGANSHAVLRPFEKKRAVHQASQKPRLFVYGARTEVGIQTILDEAHKHTNNVEFHALCQETANNPTRVLPYRGATILNARQEFSEIHKAQSKPREVWFIYSGMGNQWIGMGRCLMELKTFRDAIEEIHSYLKPLGIDLMDLLMNCTAECLNQITNPFIMITAVQIGLTDLLTAMGIKPDGIIGHSLGEVCCGYADGCLTKREAIMAAYWRAKSTLGSKLPKGQMAAVGLTWEQAQARCPAGVYPACHNSDDNVTISGEFGATKKFMEELVAEGTFVKEVNSNNVAYHTPNMDEAAEYMRSELEKIIVPKPRTKRWVSTSLPESKWESPQAQNCGAPYHAINMTSPVLFYEGLTKIPPTAIAIEVSPMGLLQSVIKKTLGPSCFATSLQKRLSDNNVEFFFSALGKCYAQGLDMKPLGIYPAVEFPVSIGTPMLSGLVVSQWDHSQDWEVPRPEDWEDASGSAADASYDVDTSQGSEYAYLLEHAVDGRPLLPACGYLYFAWKTFAKLKGLEVDQCPVELTNVEFHSVRHLSPDETETVTVKVKASSGEFELYSQDGTTLLATGIMSSPDDEQLDILAETSKKTESVVIGKEKTEIITRDEIYRELTLRGYDYGPYFQGLERTSADGKDADVRWNGRWISYLDALLQVVILSRPGESLLLPIKTDTVLIDPRVHPADLQNDENPTLIPGRYNQDLDMITAGGVAIQGVHTIMASRRLSHPAPDHLNVVFEPYTDVQEGDVTYPPTNLAEYTDALQEMMRQGITRWLNQDKYNVMPNTEVLHEALDMLNNMGSGKFETSSYEEAKANVDRIIQEQGFHEDNIARVAHIGFSEPYNENFVKSVQPKLHGARGCIWTDPLLKALESIEIVTSMIDLVKENTVTPVVNILEVGAIKSGFYRSLYPDYINHYYHRQERYTVSDVIADDAYLGYPVKNINFNPYDPTSIPIDKEGTQDIVVLKQVLYAHKDLDEAFEAYSSLVAPGGFILIREQTNRFPLLHVMESVVRPVIGGDDAVEGKRVFGCYYTDEQWKEFFDRHGYELIYERQDGIMNSLYLLRKRFEPSASPKIVVVDDLNASWLEEVKQEFEYLQYSSDDERLWLVSSNYCSGVHGFAACIRWEQGGDKVRFAHVSNLKDGSSTMDFDPDSEEFQNLMQKDLVYNVCRDGRWGAFRAFKIKQDAFEKERPRDHVYADCVTAGDQQSLRWLDHPLNVHKDKHQGLHSSTDVETCSVYYASINDRDIQLSAGKLKRDDLPTKWFYNTGVLGVEFSGRDSAGNRVMGFCPPPALASTVQCPRSCLLPVPTEWNLEEAATIPLAYSQAYLALVQTARLRKGQSVFVEAGWTDIGQALIQIALNYGCSVFTLARSMEDIAPLRLNYPELNPSQIYTRGSNQYVKDIRVATKGKGVDVVLQCLPDEIIKSNIKLLAKEGVFLDMSREIHSHRLQFLLHAPKEATFQRVNIESVLANQGLEWTKVLELLKEGIASGVVKPLRRWSYEMKQLVGAFKNAEENSIGGKHIIKIRNEENQKIAQAPSRTFPAVFRTFFSPHKSYAIIGGLGGLGLEFSDWMVSRGARKLVLTSRRGVVDAYQTRKLAYLRRLGAQVEAVALNVNTEENAKQLVEICTKLGPIGGFYNLGMVLKDALLSEQTAEDYEVCLTPKVTTTQLLDKLSRESPVRESLDHFVLFSSANVYGGFLGQSNYCWANSVMERICEKRKAEGLPGLAIEWGAVADVGVVAGAGSEHVNGKLPQRIYSIKNSSDFCLSSEEPVLSALVLKEVTDDGDEGNNKVQAITDKVARTLGYKNMSSVDGDKEFIDLGVDSLMSVEIKHILERDAGLDVNSNDIRLLTFNSLVNMIEGQ